MTGTIYECKVPLVSKQILSKMMCPFSHQLMKQQQTFSLNSLDDTLLQTLIHPPVYCMTCELARMHQQSNNQQQDELGLVFQWRLILSESGDLTLVASFLLISKYTWWPFSLHKAWASSIDTCHLLMLILLPKITKGKFLALLHIQKIWILPVIQVLEALWINTKSKQATATTSVKWCPQASKWLLTSCVLNLHGNKMFIHLKIFV